MNRIQKYTLNALSFGHRKTLRAFGFTEDVRHQGAQKLVIWRKDLSAKAGAERGALQSRSKKRLVVIPGFADSALSWLPVSLFLQPTLRKSTYDEIMLLDIPGISTLTDTSIPPNLGHIFEHTHDVLDALSPHTLVAHSLGGMIASEYAIKRASGARPEKLQSTANALQKLVLVDALGLGGDAEEDHSKQIAKLKQMQSHEYLEALFGETGQVFPGGKLSGKGLRKKIFKKISKAASPLLDRVRNSGHVDVLAETLSKRTLDRDGLRKMGSSGTETYLIWGDQDEITPSRWLEAWQKNMNLSGHHLLPGIGHCPHMETPFETAYWIGKFLREEKQFLKSGD